VRVRLVEQPPLTGDMVDDGFMDVDGYLVLERPLTGLRDGSRSGSSLDAVAVAVAVAVGARFRRIEDKEAEMEPESGPDGRRFRSDSTDLAFGLWTKSCSDLPLRLHRMEEKEDISVDEVKGRSRTGLRDGSRSSDLETSSWK